jgi:uncharacterized repeat protein (TIGR01451 family)
MRGALSSSGTDARSRRVLQTFFAFVVAIGVLPATVTAVVVATPTTATAGPPPPPAITQVPLAPGQRYGGRQVSADINPFDNTKAITATEDDGLYMTSDTGATWARVDSFPQFRMADVKASVRYDPNDPNVIIASTIDDGQVTAQSGIWRSTDGGLTWNQAAVTYPCTARPNAFDIAVVPGNDVHQKMFVANDCGVAYTNDSGATWANIDPVGLGGTRFVSVAAVRTGTDAVQAYACTSSQIYKTAVSGGATPSWTLASGGLNGCDLAISPLNSQVVLLSSVGGAGTAQKWRLFESDDGAATFTPLFPLTDVSITSGNGRPAPVITHKSNDGNANHFDVYWNNTTNMFRQPCNNDNNPATPDCPVVPETGAQCANAIDDDGDSLINEGCPRAGANPPGSEKAGAVPGECKNNLDDDGDGAVNDGCSEMEFFLNGTHVDDTDLAFDPTVANGLGCPMYATSDGGIGKTTDCGLSWTDSNDGLEALQIQNLWGTLTAPGPTGLDLAFGTQDNNFYFTEDGTATWTEAQCCEGFAGQTDHRLPPGGFGDIRYVFTDCGPCGNILTGRGFGNAPNPGGQVNIGDMGWPEPPGGGSNLIGNASVPIQYANQRWAQIGNLGNQSTFQVWVTQPETGAQCANNTDDDADGAVNDGCPPVGGSETGAQCHNNIDDDGGDGGVVNDGCSYLYSVESGGECGNGLDEDSDTVVNDGCTAVGPDTDGDGNPDPETKAQCLNAADDDGDGVINDGCPQVGVFAPMGPSFTTAPLKYMQASGPPNNPTFYLPVSSGGKSRLMRLAGPLNPTATLSNASGSGANQLDDIVSRGTANLGQTEMFTVAPDDPLKLYAADNTGQKVRFSTDGGATWKPDDELTALVTNNGQYNWNTPGGSTVWSLNFDPEDASKILVGTEYAGAYASVDSGADWFNVGGSTNNVPRITSFFFDEDRNKIYASSYGHSLWVISLPTTDLAVTKTDSPDPATAGEQLYYTITATNNGPNAATAEVIDTLPPEVTYVTNDLAPPDSCTEGPTGTVRCQIGVLQSGESKSFRIKVAIKPDAVVDTGPKSIVNTVRIQSTDTADSDMTNNVALDTTIVEDKADLAVTKLCKPDTTVLAGQPIDCTVFVDNYGPSYARNVVVDDTILANGTFTVSNTNPPLVVGTPGCTLSPVTGGQLLSCRLGNLANASTTTTGRATITYTISADEGMDINNVAKVRSDTPDPDATNNTATVNLTVTAVADLALTKSGPGTATAGTDINYTLSVTNNGPSAAKNVIITDTEPSAVQILSITPSTGACNAGVPGDPLQPTKCSFGTLGVGASASVVISVHIKPDTLGTIHDDARASSDTFDTDLSNNLATLATDVTASADLSITKGSSPNPVLAGQQLTYTLIVTNNGPSTAVGVKITDTLPNGTSFVSGVDGNGTTVCALVQANTVVCDLGTMPPTTSKTVLITVLVAPSVPDGTHLINSATVSSTTPDPNLANNTVTNDTTVNTQAELWLDKTAVLRSGNPAPVVVYTLYVHNNAGCETDAQSGATPNCGAGGPSDAQGITVTDKLPLDYKKVTVQFLSPQCAWTKATNTVVCTTATIPAGATATFVIEVQVQGSVGTITNTATVTSTTADPVIANNTNAAATVVKGGTGKNK